MSAASIPNRIREWRNRRRMSLAELGEIIGLSRSEISKLENGSRRVRADHLVILAKALKVAPDDLMDQGAVRALLGDDVPFSSSPVAAALRAVPARRQNGVVVVQKDDVGISVEAPPQLANAPGAYAFYMPDGGLDPRVPVGALMFVHPLLPPRDGDLALVSREEAPPVLVSVAKGAGGLVGMAGTGEPIALTDAAIRKVERIVGMWFP